MPRSIVRLVFAVSMFLFVVPARAGDDLVLSMEILDRLDALPAAVDVSDERLDAVLAAWSAQWSVPVLGDWDALAGIGIRPRDPVTFAIRDASASSALAGLSMALAKDFARPRFDVSEGRVVLTTIDGLGAMQVTDVYDVRGLLESDAVLERLQRRRPVDPGRPEEEADAPPTNEPGLLPPMEPIDPASVAPRPRATELVDLIVEHVDPDLWVMFGGVAARVSERDGVLMISAPASTHRKIRQALRRLQATMPRNVTFDLAVIEVAGPVMEQLRRRHDANSDTLVRAALRHDDTIARWRTSAVVAIGRRLEVHTTKPDVDVALHVLPTFDASLGLLSLEIRLDAALSGTSTEMLTAVDLTMPYGGVLLDLGAAGRASGLYLAVLPTM